jgi:hypothetical protein
LLSFPFTLMVPAPVSFSLPFSLPVPVSFPMFSLSFVGQREDYGYEETTTTT